MFGQKLDECAVKFCLWTSCAKHAKSIQQCSRDTVKSYAEEHCAEEHQFHLEIRTFLACDFAEIRTYTSIQDKHREFSLYYT